MLIQFDYISDLHTDFHCREYNPTHRNFKTQLNKFAKSLIPESPSNTLLIAGDLGHRFSQDSYLLTKLKETYKDILFVPGNHDRYLISNSIKESYGLNHQNRIDEFKAFCDSTPNLHFLDGNTITIDSVTYGGCGMSWDKTHYELLAGASVPTSEVVEFYTRYLNDYRNISTYLHKFDPISFFDSQYSKLSSIPKADVILTHYAPLLHPSMPTKYQSHPGTSFYYFDGQSIIDKLSPTAWVFGHTHTPAIDLVNDTTFLCNPLGYPNENPGTTIKTFTKEIIT